MGQGKQRNERQERLYEATRATAHVLEPVPPLGAQTFLLAVLVSDARHARYDMLDNEALQQTADAVAAHVRQSVPGERFCLVAFPALYPLFGLYDAEQGTLAFETRARQAVLAAKRELDTGAWCMARAVVAQIRQAAPELEESDAQFDAAVLCYLPVVLIGEEPLSDALREVFIQSIAGVASALGKLRQSQNLEVGNLGLFPGEFAQPVYDMLASEALATRIAQARDAQPRFHFIADRQVLSAGAEVWLGHLAFADLAEEAQDEQQATQWLMEEQRFFAELRRKLTEHRLTVRTAFLDWEDDPIAEQTLQDLRSGQIASGEAFLIEFVEGEAGEGAERVQLTEYFYEDQFVLGVFSATRGTGIAFQQNLYPCSPTGQQAIVAHAEQAARAAGRPLERIRHDGPVLACPHCFEPVPLITQGDEEVQPLTHSLH